MPFPWFEMHLHDNPEAARRHGERSRRRGGPFGFTFDFEGPGRHGRPGRRGRGWGPFGGPPGGGPGWPFGGPPGGPPGWSPFGRGPKVRRGDVRTAALSLIAEGPRNGYQIIQDIAERSGGLWKPSSGSVYPALQQLEDEGLIRSETEEGRRAFHLTDTGRAYVDAHQEELRAPWDEVTAGVDDKALGLWQLIGQVSIAVAQVSQAGTPAQVQQARQILNNARRALYGLLAEGEDDAPEDSETV
jgi:DNA-binding PadR family transcriptional regulator